MRAECFSACVWYEEQDYCFCEHVHVTDATDDKLTTDNKLRYTTDITLSKFPLEESLSTGQPSYNTSRNLFSYPFQTIILIDFNFKHHAT